MNKTNNAFSIIKSIVFKLTPPQAITVSFALMIFIGALLLNLPMASNSGQSVGFLNALFTAVSANCVTGLVVVNTTYHWTPFGKLIILILIQLGALGFMSVLTLLMVFMGRKVSLKDRLIIQASFSQNNVGGMVRLVKNILIFTFIAEVTGGIILTLYFYFNENMLLVPALSHGFFHAISAFCNAGFDIAGTESLVPYRNSLLINTVICTLIVSGGLGFTVWFDLFKNIKKGKKNKKRIGLIWGRLSLHSKIALTLTAVLIISGAGLFFLLEWNNPETMGNLPIGEKIMASLFQSVTLRTAGFNTINQSGLTEASLFLSCILMLIGGSPAGTAGGIKTVPLGIILFSMISALKGRNRVEAYGRRISFHILQKALTIAFMMITLVLISTFLLYFTERNSSFTHGFLDLLFEASSAAGTAGITAGITPYLSPAGKIIIILCMFIGRLGPITIGVALNIKLNNTRDTISFPEEDVIIG